MPILELLADVDDIDPNLADNDGNTPLIFAAQAGNKQHRAHDQVVTNCRCAACKLHYIRDF